MAIRDTKEYEIGKQAEEFVFERWREKGKIVTSYSEDLSFQRRGIDYSIKDREESSEIFYDNKNNMFKVDSNFLFAIEIKKEDGRAGWLYTSQATRISHSNMEYNYIIYYDLEDVRNFVSKLLERDPSRVRITKKGDTVLYLQVEAMLRKGLIYEM